jgi:serine/threonine protein kinase
MSLAPGTRLGPYEIVALIGAGGMGEVYRVRDTKLKREVALKLLPDTFAQDAERMARFEREACVLAALNHPNIAHIYSVEERALVMELVEGETLSSPLPLETALNYARQIAQALEYAHEKGVIHRDLKPANIKVTPEGVVKLLDFGLAKAIEDPGGPADDPSISPTLTLGATRVGMIMGTAAYMSPEQASGKTADRRADIWSFGAVLYEMLAGKKAFEGESVSDTLASVLKLDPDWDALPAATPSSIRRLVQRCLTKDRKQRLQAIGEARITLESPTSEESVPVTAPSQWRLGTGSSITAGVLLIVLGILSFIHFRETPPRKTLLRYTIPAPENSRLQSFAISPNGRYVAIATAVQGKRQQLWLRALDTMQAQELPGTEDAAYPFWSPDSRFIGFFAQGKLKKIAASGGPAQSLCDVPDGRGGSWGSNAGSGEDVILFSPGGGNQFAIQQVPATGGVPADVSKTKGRYFSPIFLPGGRHFLYLVTGATPFFGDIYLGSLDSNENRRVLAGVSQLVFAPSAAGSSTGHLLFVRQNILMAQPFDARSAQISGNAVPIAESVSVPGPTLIMMTASENGVLVYRTTEGEADMNQIVWFDRAGKRLGSVGAPGNVRTPSISPDEKKVAFTRLTSSGTADLWLWDLIRGTETRLTSDSSFNVGPSWAPDVNTSSSARIKAAVAAISTKHRRAGLV